jgi:rare lipoprotein A
MPSTTDDRSPRASRGLVFKLTPVFGLLMLGACVPGVTFPGSGPVTQAPPAPSPTEPVRIAFAPPSLPEQIQEAAPEPDELDLSLAREVGIASWYGPRFQGRRTSSGEKFNQHEMTAAHKSLPFGSRVRVTNVESGQSVEVRITDRGPRSPKRIIDVSSAAANAIGLKRPGLGVVQVDLLPDLGGGVLAQETTGARGPRRTN